MKITMVLGVQGEFKETLEPGMSYDVGTQVSERFAQHLIDRGAGYFDATKTPPLSCNGSLQRARFLGVKLAKPFAKKRWRQCRFILTP